MGLWEELDDLQVAIQDMSQGINAMEAVTLGLLYAKQPYADGLNALSTYLAMADREVHRCLEACLKAV